MKIKKEGLVYILEPTTDTEEKDLKEFLARYKHGSDTDNDPPPKG